MIFDYGNYAIYRQFISKEIAHETYNNLYRLKFRVSCANRQDLCEEMPHDIVMDAIISEKC